MAVGAPDRGLQSVSLARSALQQGRRHLASGDKASALRWLDRAHRLVPLDRNVMLTLATALVGSDDHQAVNLFTQIVDEDDLQPAWIGLAAAQMRIGNNQAAADAIARALGRCVLPPSIADLATEIVRRVQAPGWCGLTASGVVEIHPLGAGTPVIRLDGTKQAGRQLPPDWVRHTELTVCIGDRPLLGSPIALHAIARAVGRVEAFDGGLRGWVWHPADPGTDPALAVVDCTGNTVANVTAADHDITVADLGPLAIPRGFAVPAKALGSFSGPLHVIARDGRDLAGSPLDPQADQRAAMLAAQALARLYPAELPPPTQDDGTPPAIPSAIRADLAVPERPTGADRRRRPVDVIVPVHGQRDLVLACLDMLFGSVTRPNRIVVVDDASRDPDLIAELDRLARARRIRLIRNPRNLGFPGSANAGIMAAKGRDVVLLNSDTLVPPGWLDRMVEAAHAADDIATVTPLSNNASILSYPGDGEDNAIPDLRETIALDRLTRRVNGSATVEIPVGVGFCIYIRRDCLNAVGRFRDDVFAQGYGEENDFCLRARRLGWRHVALPGLFVGHCSGRSFGSAGPHLRTRNGIILDRLHPGYGALVDTFLKADPLAAARRRLDQARWRNDRGGLQEAAILITHTHGGGVERRVIRSAADHARAGRRPIIIRPATTADGAAALQVSDGPDGRYPNLLFRMPQEGNVLLRWLRSQRPVVVEAHHFLEHPPSIYDVIAELGVPYEAHIHDYASFCPRISLVGAQNRYCGEPDITACQACVDDLGSFLTDDLSVAELRTRSAGFLAGARQVIAPSRDAASRITRHFPDIRPIVVPHDDDRLITHAPSRRSRPVAPVRSGGRHRVCVLGAIGVHKGYDVLLACARDAAERGLNLEFVVVGATIDDARLLATGHVFVTGQFKPDEVVALVQAQQADCGFLPSIWPETWCMALSDLWHAGLRVAAFDLGAPAERIRQTGNGFLLPLHLSAGAINNALVADMSPSIAKPASPLAHNQRRTVSRSDASNIVTQVL